MLSASKRQASLSAAPRLSISLRAALTLLLPHDNRPDVEDSAIAMAQLRSIGLSDMEFHWLVEFQLIEPRETIRRPLSRGGRALRRTVLFQLTRAGVIWAREILAPMEPAPSAPLESAQPGGVDPDLPEGPRWDADQRTLSWGSRILLQFQRRHACNIEPILAAFEKQAWKACIANSLPLEKESKFDPRLHDAIKHLNKRLKGAPLRFHGSGDGRGVRCEPVRAGPARCSPGVP
jgi:hypothetical protein